MRFLPDGAWMQRADADTIERIGIPSEVLMERAAVAVVDFMKGRCLDKGKSLVVCGSGNNGGDGFAVARLLEQMGLGHDVTVFFAGKEASMSRECRLQAKIAKNLGVKIVTEIPEGEYNIIVDAIFGVGLSREVGGHYAEIVEWMNGCGAVKLAIDIPSGIDAGTGQVLGTAFRADHTVTFQCGKLGCVLFPGAEYAGEVHVANIGIDTSVFAGEEGVCFTLDAKDAACLLPTRPADSHKGTFGKVLMICGSRGMAGAAYLSARAAYTCGAGLVQIYTHESNRAILQQLLPEAIVSTYGDEMACAGNAAYGNHVADAENASYERGLTDVWDVDREGGEDKLSSLLSWADVVCIGCGLGQDAMAGWLLEETLLRCEAPCVVDADGLNLLSRRMGLLQETKADVVLTPHMKEMSRLLGCPLPELESRRFDKLREFVGRYPVVCALKDSRTVVAADDRQMFVNTLGNNGMAKAGSGDVLAGVIAAFLVQTKSTFRGAVLGVLVHACGGDGAREKCGGFGMLARDLIDGIQTFMRRAEMSKERKDEKL
jgi:NAD(P)H-hydrate epimerase